MIFQIIAHIQMNNAYTNLVYLIQVLEPEANGEPNNENPTLNCGVIPLSETALAHYQHREFPVQDPSQIGGLPAVSC